MVIYEFDYEKKTASGFSYSVMLYLDRLPQKINTIIRQAINEGRITIAQIDMANRRISAPKKTLTAR